MGPNGRVFATEGQQLSLGGGEATPPLEHCSVGHEAFSAGAVHLAAR
jgi:hypothetical protein